MDEVWNSKLKLFEVAVKISRWRPVKLYNLRLLAIKREKFYEVGL
ncbi:hypothetical protein [uncultured Campylobacter sp.]|nr:hypothetical protein [uncultured Campylobacter sp.]